MLAHSILAIGAGLLGVAQAIPRNAELGHLIPRKNDWLPRKTCVVPSFNGGLLRFS